MDPGAGDSAPLDPKRLEALWLESAALRQESIEARARARATRHLARRGRLQREILHASAFARLQARLDTMPVIEQAKGIIMAEQRCGPVEAFDLLRRASQRANVKVHVLAAQLIRHIAAGSNGDNVTPISLGTMRYRQSRTRQGHDPLIPPSLQAGSSQPILDDRTETRGRLAPTPNPARF